MTLFFSLFCFKATGGSGNYKWSCDPEGVVGVSSSGTLATIARGMSLVIAADKKNQAHYDQSEVGRVRC